MTPLPNSLTEAGPTGATMSEHVLSEEECVAITNRLDVLPAPAKIHDYMRAATAAFSGFVAKTGS